MLFADLVGSTAFASHEDPERVRVLLDAFYQAMAEEAESAGGTVEKFAGDAVLAAFGAWAAQEDHAERALHAALAMRRRFAELFGDRLALRIGVNTGEVAVGPARVGGAFISGDAVNVAARLEQAAPPGEVLVSERTVAAVREAFDFGDAEVIAAKGKEGGVACRHLLGARSLRRPRGISGLGTAFVGRESELDVLRATFGRATAQREPHLLTIVGEPGVGKTRLVHELWSLLDRGSPPPVRRTGRCLPYGDGITYWPVAEIVKEHFALLDSDPPERVLEVLGERRILALALGLDVAGDSHPLDAREKLHAAVVELFEVLGGERPVVVLVEDLHWAEDDFLDLLDRILREGRSPLLLLATARPELLERRPHWGGGRRNTATIWLEPLQPAETSRLVDELLAFRAPSSLRDLLVERVEGNPFFLEELVGALLDSGVLERSEEGVQVRDPSGLLAVPDSVYAVLAARIDRLPATEKAALQAASVVGRLFWRDSVVQLLDGVEPSFDLLEERDFVRAQAVSSLTGESELEFKHALTREVAYAGIPKARRGRLHAAFAAWLEQTDRASDEQASLLAYHYSQAVAPEDADLAWADDPAELARLRARSVRWLRRSGELARRRNELEEAAELLTRAVELGDDEHERALVWHELGRVHALRYDGEAMRAALLRALEGPLDRAEQADTYALLAFQASLRSAMWPIRLNRHTIAEWGERALELAADGSDAQARALLSRVHVAPGEATEELVERAASAADALDDRALRSYALGARSATAYEHRRFQEAATWSERRLELLGEIDDPDHLCEAYEAGVPAAAAAGRFDEAKRLAELHGELARRLSPHHRVHAVSLELEIEDALGDWGALARETDRAANAIAHNLATPCVRNPRSLLLLAVAHLCLGDEARSAELERDAVRVVGEGYDTYLACPRLRAALEKGDRSAAAALVELPVERAFVWGPAVFATRLDGLVALGEHEAIEREALELALSGAYTEPFALRALGAARRDDELLAQADERFRAVGLDWHAAQTERLLAGL